VLTRVAKHDHITHAWELLAANFDQRTAAAQMGPKPENSRSVRSMSAQKALDNRVLTITTQERPQHFVGRNRFSAR